MDGDTSTLDVLIVPPVGLKPAVNRVSRSVDLYVPGEWAEWLIDKRCEPGMLLEAKVKLLYTSIAGITDEGTEEIIVVLEMIKGISVSVDF